MGEHIGGFIGLGVGALLVVTVGWTAAAACYGNPVRFWAWVAGHLLHRHSWIDWGSANGA